MNDRAISISLDSSRQSPNAFIWQGRMHKITGILECWRTVGAWWDGEGERTIFRVAVEGGGIFELSYDHRRRAWALDRVED